MRILLTINSLEGTAAGRACLTYARHLIKKGHPCSLIVYSHRGDLRAPAGLPVQTIDFDQQHEGWKKWMVSGQRYVQLRWAIHRFAADCVLSFGASANLQTLIAVERMDKKKKPFTVVFEQDPLIPADDSNPSRAIALRRKLYPKADLTLAVSAGVRKDILRAIALAPEKVKTLANPFNFETLREQAREKVDHPWFNISTPLFVHVGTFEARANQPLLIRAFKRLLERRQARLALIGAGSLESQWQQLAADLGVADRIAFLGYQSNPYKYIAKASALVSSSNLGGFGNVVVEALACGVPVAATDGPYGLGEIVQSGINGFLTPAENEEALSRAMESLIADPDTRHKMAVEAPKTVEKFSAPAIVDQLVAMLPAAS